MGTPSHLGHMDRVTATMPSQAHAGAAQEAPDIGQWEGQDIPLVRPSSCFVKGGIPSSQRYPPTYLLCASLCLSRQLCTEGPRCCRLQNIGDGCSMPLLQIQTRCASLLPNYRKRFHAVLSRCTPIIAICKYVTRLCARARATRRANSRLATYYYLPRERRVMGLLAVLKKVPTRTGPRCTPSACNPCRFPPD